MSSLPRWIHLTASLLPVSARRRVSPAWAGFFEAACNGLAFFLNWVQREVFLWDPISDQQRRISFPLPLRFTDGAPKIVMNAAVVCAEPIQIGGGVQ